MKNLTIVHYIYLFLALNLIGGILIHNFVWSEKMAFLMLLVYAISYIVEMPKRRIRNGK